MTNPGKREMVGRDHHLLARTSIEKGSACLRALIEIQVEPAAPIGVLEGDGAVPNNISRTELARTGRDLDRGVAGRVPGCRYRRYARDHLAVRLHRPNPIIDRRERFMFWR
ncbi:hypothetical protein [Bradyrhizobium sp. sBnM-33]|uniref:hypothetical protein n=1 Tax=Bradyrhizobium sp. sBnM-33 TaxID=2831780 RepID=UPI0020C01AB2|nr:hypothetical protein [Bradyrhizobium sp. sBnM-33]WOH47215.1 hypothetical protein RX328_23735 [Bradyrhizobium sp. sBnM-33]